MSIADEIKELVYTDGKLDEEKVFKEMHDFLFMIEEVPKVYNAVTWGKLSKPNYYASVVIGEFEQHLMDNYLDKEILQSDIRDILKEKMPDSDKLDEIKKYLDLISTH